MFGRFDDDRIAATLMNLHIAALGMHHQMRGCRDGIAQRGFYRRFLDAGANLFNAESQEEQERHGQHDPQQRELPSRHSPTRSRLELLAPPARTVPADKTLTLACSLKTPFCYTYGNTIVNALQSAF